MTSAGCLNYPCRTPDDPKTPAKELFGRKIAPTAAQPHVVGFYASGCLAGAVTLPIVGAILRPNNSFAGVWDRRDERAGAARGVSATPD